MTALAPAAAASPDPVPGDAAPRLGLVLAGGGARGAAHVGVLKVLEELGIRPDLIVGTSMGAIVGGLYASGIGADELAAALAAADWDRIFTDDPGRAARSMRRKQLDRALLVQRRLGFNRGGLQVPLGTLQGQHLDQMLKGMLGATPSVPDFDRLPIRFRAVATDLASGEAVILDGGNLVQAMRASMSVPGIFSPVAMDGRLLADGGVAMNTPVELAQALGAERLIVVDISTPLFATDELDSAWRIAQQMARLLTRRNTERSLALMGDADVLIRPNLAGIGAVQFDRAAEAVVEGELAARERASELMALVAGLPLRPPPPAGDAARQPRLDFVDIDNGSRLHDEALWSRIRVEPGDRLDAARLERDLSAIYALDVFDIVRYEVIEDADRGTGLVVTAEPRHWGPNYLQFGVALTSDLSTINDFTLGAAYTRNAVTRRGGDVRLFGNVGRVSGLAIDMYQPLDRRGRWFMQPELALTRERRDLFDGGRNLGTLEINHLGVSLASGRNYGNRLQLRGEIERARQSLDGVRGLLDVDERREQIGELRLRALYDDLDSIDFSTRGAQLEAEWLASTGALGAGRDFRQLELTASRAFTRERWTFLARGTAGLSWGAEPAFTRLYRLGGFGQLSGLAPDALIGAQSAMGGLALYRRIGNIRFLPVYAGASIESGNVWDARSDVGFDELRFSGSVFLGLETLLGPVYIAWGHSDGGASSFYLHLGNPFDFRRR